MAEGEGGHRVSGYDLVLWVLNNLGGIKDCGGHRFDVLARF
jgi:hypothetical protein